MSVDLRKCKAGDLLLSCHGQIFTYVGPTPTGNYYDHFVTYPDGGEGTRTNDGYVMRNPARRLPTDHNIVEILPPFDEV